MKRSYLGTQILEEIKFNTNKPITVFPYIQKNQAKVTKKKILPPPADYYHHLSHGQMVSG
jgi:hypothetical protein